MKVSRWRRWRLRRINQQSHDNATTCMCGKPAVVRVQSPWPTPYRPWWGSCEEHRGMPLTQGWQRIGDGPWEPTPLENITLTKLDGSPAPHVYGIEEPI